MSLNARFSLWLKLTEVAKVERKMDKKPLPDFATDFDESIALDVEWLCRVQDKSMSADGGVAIDQPLLGLVEYIDGKLNGRESCLELSRLENIYVVCHRLHRIETVRTLSLSKVLSADLLEVILPLIRRMVTENRNYT